MSVNSKLVIAIPVLLFIISCKSVDGLKRTEDAQIASVSSAGDYISIETTRGFGYIIYRENITLRLVGTTAKPSVHVFGIDDPDSKFKDIHAEIWVSTPQEYNSWLEFISDKDKSPRQKIP